LNFAREQLLQWIEQDQAKIIQFFSEFTKCKSPNPPGDTRSSMDHVQRFLRVEGISFKEVNARDDMPNLIASFTAPAAGRHLMLNGHLDVFPAGLEPGWTDDPWSGKIADGRVWGRGSADMKAGTTAAVFAFAYLSRLREQLKGKLSLTVVSDEETGGVLGVGHMFQRIPAEMAADCVLSGEPSNPKSIRFAAKGFVHFSVRVKTRGAHAGYPNLSPNAIRISSEIIRDLDQLTTMPVETPPLLAAKLNDPSIRRLIDEILGAGTAEVLPRVTVNIGIIQGGSKVNVIAADCIFEVDTRIPIGCDHHKIVARAKQIVARYPEAAIEKLFVAPSDYADPEGEMAAVLRQTVKSLGWTQPELLPSLATSDCRYWRDRGTPAYWYGPSSTNICAADESVSIEELLHIVRTHTVAAAQFLLR
jgi:acetylornithine deacetylase/succinyl-diaminopimelate desuccinylase-like protein